MGELSNILDRKDKRIHAVGPDATIHDAVSTMCRAGVGALLVLEDDTLLGILTERDIMTRVMLEKRDPTTANVSSVMSTNLACIAFDADASEAMALMTARRCRHLPVLRDGRVAGIVSMGDLVHWVTTNQEFEIRMLTEYVSGVYTHPG